MSTRRENAQGLRRSKQRKRVARDNPRSPKSIVLKWSDKRHLKVVLRYAFCCISTRWDAECLENSENEKKTLCGQSPLVDTKNIAKVKKTADFIRNQPFLLVRVGRFELPASWTQIKRPTNWATPGYEIREFFAKWSNMWSKVILDRSFWKVKGEKC